MNDREMELLIMIRENPDPAQAMITALEIITDYLAQHGSFE